VDDKKKLETSENQIEKLESIQSRLYDDYRANSILRRSFRVIFFATIVQASHNFFRAKRSI